VKRAKKAPKAKMGRPPLPEGMVRETFTIRITAAEREAFARAAEQAGKPVTQWAREALLALACA
jgi:hypothetical protein